METIQVFFLTPGIPTVKALPCYTHVSAAKEMAHLHRTYGLSVAEVGRLTQTWGLNPIRERERDLEGG